MKLLHAADLHIDSPLRDLDSYPGAPAEQLRNATRNAVDNLVSLALEEKVTAVLLAGDVYDGSWDNYRTGLYFTEQMHRLREADIPVFMISGQELGRPAPAAMLPAPGRRDHPSGTRPSTPRNRMKSVH